MFSDEEIADAYTQDLTGVVVSPVAGLFADHVKFSLFDHERRLRNQRERRMRRLLSGRCVHCDQGRDDRSALMCSDHAAKHTASARNSYRRRRGRSDSE